MNIPLSEMLRHLRIKKRLSRQQLSDALSVDRSTVAKWETGDRQPDAVTITRLSGILGANVAELKHAAGKRDEKPTVILVDDERIILNGSLPVLEQTMPNARVTGFTVPAEALAFARENPVTLDFAGYLGKSFNAISGNEMIPFTEELEHTRAYLAVEKARYEEELFFEFDTPHTFFKLPPLTLQPVVENAVKHGISPHLGPLYLSVRTRATEEGSEIIVEDTGPGFSPADDNEPHLALANIRERLALTCSGTLEITNRETGGTRVTIRIPMKMPDGERTRRPKGTGRQERLTKSA